MFGFTDNVFGEGSSSSSTFPTELIALFAVIPILTAIALSSGPIVVMASQELTVYRMQHLDFQGSPKGCRNSLMNLEARTIHQFSESFARKCVIVKLRDLMNKPDAFEELINQAVAGGMLVLLPNSFLGVKDEDEATLLELEKAMLSETVHIPVYFAHETEELLAIYDEIDRSSWASQQTNVSGVHRLVTSVLANGYQMVIPGSQAIPVKDPIMSNIEGKLTGNGVDDQLPTITITAHYDAYGVAPGLSFGGDSNGSGVVALLELARLFSKLYSNPRTHPRVNLIFLLSGGGKFSYLGTKKWIEEQLDNSESSLLADSVFTACLDSVADTDEKNGLYMHVSKPPKESSLAAAFFKSLQQVSQIQTNPLNVSMVHKKINLADDSLSWEHERFSFRRLPAFTLSSLSSHRYSGRSTIFDTCDRVNVDSLSKNVQVISEALASQVFNIRTEAEAKLFDSDLQVSKSFVSSVLSQLCSQPRSQQLLLTTQKGSTYQLPPLLSTLEHIMKKYIRDIDVHHFRPDKREPEVVFYEPTVTKMNIYNVKPAIFDLFLSVVIVAYLGVVYAFLVGFHHMQGFAKALKTYTTTSTQNGVSVKGKQQ